MTDHPSTDGRFSTLLPEVPCQGGALRSPAMGTYRGPAVLITDDGAEFGVGANLRSRQAGLESWGGQLTIAGEHWTAIANKDRDFQLRLPTGRVGKFQRPNPTEMPPPPGQPFMMAILGDGDAPF